MKDTLAIWMREAYQSTSSPVVVITLTNGKIVTGVVVGCCYEDIDNLIPYQWHIVTDSTEKYAAHNSSEFQTGEYIQHKDILHFAYLFDPTAVSP